MAKRKPQRRIEPSFDGPRKARGAALSATDEDRAVRPRRKKTKGSGRKRTPARAARRRRGLLGLAGKAAYWMLILAIWGGVAAAGMIAFYGARMPSVTTWAVPDRPPNVKIVSVDGKLVANRGMTGGEAVGLHKMSPYIPMAVIAIEDRRFNSHFGIDPLGLGRAMVLNLIEGHVVQGGSTLTQQLAKNMFLKPDRTIERKVQEVLLALWLEHKYTKDQILTMYLNRVYFGSGAYGVEAASRRYFGKSARDVTLSEAALLAGLLKAPSRLSPARDPKAAEARAQLVIAAMREQGMIGDSEFASAMGAPATRAAAYWTGSENYVADEIMEELPDLIGEVGEDIVVDTTLDLTLQKLAESTIRDLIKAKGGKLRVSQGALVSIDGSGAVRAMVGGYDYANSQFDRASEAKRQPGSAFKPFVYLAALEAGRTPQSVRNDAPVKIGKWTPENYGGKYYGKVTLATALKKSLNSVAAQLATEVGPKKVVETAHRLGIESSLAANASIALGTSEVTPLELTSAYVPFANGGYRPDIHFIRRITTASGKVIYEHKSHAPRVIRADIVGEMNTMLEGTVEDGTARAADFGWPAAGKTGTTQKSRDAWFVGYTANLVTGVWFGNDDGSPTKGVTGGSLPARAWKTFMVAAHEGVPKAPLPGTGRGMPGAGDVLPEMAGAPGMRGAAVGEEAAPRPAAGLTGSAVPVPRSRPDAQETASIRRPVPPGSVGQRSAGGDKSILDIILGR